MHQLPSPTPTPYAPDLVLSALPAVQALPEVLRQHLWRAVHVLSASGITVRGIKPQAYALSLHLYRYELLDEEWARVVLTYNGKQQWTRSLPQGPDSELQKEALECLRRDR